MIVQMAKGLGAKVIGTMSTEAKAEMARKAGADETILYSTQDFEAEVKRITDGKGVDVVYDSVGATTFQKSLNCIRPRGMMVTFGQSSGPVGQIDPLVLTQRGSLFLTRPMLAFHIATPEELAWRAGDLLGGIASGKINIHIQKTYRLSEVQQAHRDLESRKTTGKLVLLPQ
jgi:NADPH2:quinone reductase